MEEAQLHDGTCLLDVDPVIWNGTILVSPQRTFEWTGLVVGLPGLSQAVGAYSSVQRGLLSITQENRTQLVSDHLSFGTGTQFEDRSIRRFSGAGHALLPNAGNLAENFGGVSHNCSSVSTRTDMAGGYFAGEQQFTVLQTSETAPVSAQAWRPIFSTPCEVRDFSFEVQKRERWDSLTVIRPPLRESWQTGSDVKQCLKRRHGVLSASIGECCGPGSRSCGTVSAGGCQLAQVFRLADWFAQSVAKIHGNAEAHGCGGAKRICFRPTKAKRALLNALNRRRSRPFGLTLPTSPRKQGGMMVVAHSSGLLLFRS